MLKRFASHCIGLISASSHDFITIIVISSAASLTMFFFSPTAAYFTNVLEFSIHFFYVGPSLIYYSILSTIFLVTLFFLIPFRFLARAISLLTCLTVLLWLQGNIFVWNYGIFDGTKIDWNKYAMQGLLEILIWVSFIIFAIVKPKLLYKYARIICIFFVLMQVITVTALAAKAPKVDLNKPYIDEKTKFDFGTKNVIIVTLDSFQSDIFWEVVNSNPRYNNLFEGFTYFRNTVGGFPYTYLAITVILTGHYYDNSMPVQEFMRKAFLSSSSVPKTLKDEGFQVDMFPDLECDIYCNSEVMSNVTMEKRGVVPSLRRKTTKLLYEIAMFRCVPHFIKQRIFAETGIMVKERSDKAMPTDKKSLKGHKIHKGRIDWTNYDIRFISEMVSHSKKIDGKSFFKYYHLWGLHKPFVINEKLEHVKLPQDRQGGKIHALGLMTIMEMFFDRLKTLGIYDDSLIFVIADHGLSYKVEVPPDIDAQKSHIKHYEDIKKDRGIPNRGIPLILVKPFNSRGPMEISDIPVSQSDIPATIAFELGLKKSFPGFSMFNNYEPSSRPRSYFVYHHDSKYDNSDYMSPLNEYVVSGHSWLDESWHLTGKRLIGKK